MTTQVILKATSFAGESDLVAIADLYNLCSQADHLDSWLSLDELREDISDPDFDPMQDMRLWRDARGELLVTAKLWRRTMPDHAQAYLTAFVHPAVRGLMEAELFAWAEARLQQMAAGQSRVQLGTSCRDTQNYQMALFSAYGLEVVRVFYRMARSLSVTIPEAELPEGFQVRPVNPETDAIAWVEMFNQTFIDHWNHSPMSVEDFNYYSRLSSHIPELDLVAIAPDGQLAAFCQGAIYPEENERLGRREGWITSLGTRRGYRQMGLGRAMLRLGLRALVAKGMETALLGVDSENPSGALQLYQSEGFNLRHRSVSFSKWL